MIYLPILLNMLNFVLFCFCFYFRFVSCLHKPNLLTTRSDNHATKMCLCVLYLTHAISLTHAPSNGPLAGPTVAVS